MDLNRVVNRAFIAIDAYFRGKKYISKKIIIAEKNVLIVFQQIFGDAVVIQNSLKEYLNVFPYDEGYRIKFVARPSVIAFIKETIEVPDKIEICAVDFKKFLEDYSYYKKVVKEYQGKVDTLIVPGTSLSAEVFSTANDAKRKIGLVRCIDVTSPFVMAVFAKLAYTERVRPNKDEMMLQRHRRLLHYLGSTQYKAELPKLLEKEKIIDEERYCVICPGSSKMEKCWPTERFSKVADYVIENYAMTVHLCGGKDEQQFEEIIKKQTKYSEKIISHIGKTSFSDWSAIVQHAELVVGNDSATMHLAVASRRKSVCIVGAYDKYQFFPYKVDCFEDEDRLPVTLIKDMSCEWCRTVGYNAGYGNSECKKRITNNMCACCIDMISTQDVIEKIDLLMNEDRNIDEFT